MSGTPQAFGVGGALALTDAATITLDLAAQLGPVNCISVTLGGSRTLNIKNMVPGQVIRGIISQDGSGSRVITVQVNGIAAKVSGTPLSTAGSSIDMVNIEMDANGVGYYYSVSKAFA